MAKTREIACIHYKHEGECELGREATFRHHCQTCNKYQPIPGGRPARKNLKKDKMNKILADKRNWD